MTPKEKAKELVNKFRDFTDGIDSETDRYSPNIEKKNAMQCALITVDEIIEALKDNAANSASWRYYEEVKQEIQNL